ncbi:MAG: RAMP superfamily CRISPR-associated protein [Thermacetogeniaceae bacterium]
MRRVKLCIDYSLRLMTPVHVGTGTGEAGFLDSYIYKEDRGEKKGRVPIIPGSTIKGRLRAAVRALASAGLYGDAGICKDTDGCNCLVCLIFGRRDRQGALYFDDAWPLLPLLEDAQRWVSTRSGIAIDRYRRVARDKALYTIETAGCENQIYRGRITGFIPEEFLDQVISALKDAFAFDYALGYGKSRGLGWFKAEVLEVKAGCATG